MDRRRRLFRREEDAKRPSSWNHHSNWNCAGYVHRRTISNLQDLLLRLDSTQRNRKLNAQIAVTRHGNPETWMRSLTNGFDPYHRRSMRAFHADIYCRVSSASSMSCPAYPAFPAGNDDSKFLAQRVNAGRVEPGSLESHVDTFIVCPFD
ncbi:hypothetical protein [Burkholderia ubonensis]|uniref:hypothetical protein n=1 Tax=Burkholderia ubonensis TaxID=101571 RepID=UPI0012FA4D94|nr:hypothetical protein [Burkholderia ubonensis]